MTESPEHQSPGSVEGGHVLDGMRVRLPVPSGHHPIEVVAALARLLGHRYGLEPFDMQVTDSAHAAGMLLLRAPEPMRQLELCVRRSHEAVRRASQIGSSSARLQTESTSIRERAVVLRSEIKKYLEATRELTTSVAESRRRWNEHFEASVTRALTRSPES